MSAGIRPAPALDERPATPSGRATPFGRALHALSLGVTLGGFAGMLADPRGWYVLAFVAGCVLWTLLLVVRVLGAVRAALPAGGPPAGGELALARVETIRRTGLEVNDQPQCDLVLVVAPAPGRGPAYATTARAVLDVVTLASFQRGSVVVVSRPDPALPDVTPVLHPPADLLAAARAEARLDPGTGVVPALDRVPVREPERLPARGFGRPTAGSLLTGLVLATAGGVAVLLPTLLA